VLLLLSFFMNYSKAHVLWVVLRRLGLLSLLPSLGRWLRLQLLGDLKGDGLRRRLLIIRVTQLGNLLPLLTAILKPILLQVFLSLNRLTELILAFHL
jgi:hypothetical protein